MHFLMQVVTGGQQSRRPRKHLNQHALAHASSSKQLPDTLFLRPR